MCRRIYKNKINTHIHLKIRKFPLPDEIHVLIDDFVYSREFEDNMHISRSTYLSFSKTSYLRMVWYIGRRAAATVDPKPQVDKPSDGTSRNSPAAKQAPVRAKQTLNGTVGCR